MAKRYCHFCKAHLGSSTLVLKEAIFFLLPQVLQLFLEFVIITRHG